MADPKYPGNKKETSLRGRSTRRGEDQPGFGITKVQPQALPLEEAVLGALMLDKEGLAVVLDILRPDSFYLDAHQLIFGAMLRLFERSLPVDLLTVSEELKRKGELEAAGGPSYLVELTNKVASAANIEYHARIISQKHIQRELIRVSTDIIRNAYEDTTDVFDLLDEAEQGLFSIAQQNMSRSYESMGSLASKLQKQLEELKKREDGLTGVPTGFTALDRLTSGWQPSDLIILAARPGMGKTSFVLSLAKNAASLFSKGVALFSLEMASIQLVQRLVSMEAEIPGSKLRNGQLEEYEWEQLQAAIERLSDAPIFIDDTPGINIFELRAKCRRLKMQHDIQLVIIDYLQLMSGGPENQKGNREQEVSAISRALKGMAKELNVPVIALSQLSRAVEVRGGTKRPQLSDLRESGCLTGDTLIQDALTGRRITIRELAERREQIPLQVLAVGPDYRIKPHAMIKAFYSGKKMVYELRTRTGRTIKASANHPFLKLSGWTALDKLAPGDRIAVPRTIHVTRPKNPLSQDEIILLAHLIGDGCILPKQPYHYTSADPVNIKIVSEKAKKFFDISPRLVQQNNWWHVYLPSPYQLTHGKKHPITEWYDDLGAARVRSFRKEIPAGIFQCDNDRISLFLHHLWATDGNVSWRELKGRKKSVAIYYASSSPRMAEQVQHLLSRLGIISTIRQIKQGKYRDNYHVWVQGTSMQLTFLRKVGCHGERGLAVPDMIKALEEINENPNFDVVPKEVWPLFIDPARKEQNLSWRELCARLGQSYSTSFRKNGVSAERLSRFNQVLQSEQLENLASSDVFWDEIIDIAELGEEDVYDATVEGVHNFVANDILVHNSIEQDADIVSFIYRPEYYQILEDEEGQSLKGIAEIIIAKHRNGALDTVKLRFTDKFARFSDLDEPDFGNLDTAFENPNVNIITRPSRMNSDEDIPF